MKKALIIGAYGGEHVGDAAILGGVLFRLKRDFNLDDFNVLSFREDRTIFWSSNLTHLNDVNVEVYDLDDFISKRNFNYDYVIYAGGPIMELPLLLSKFIYLVNEVLKRNGKFIIEGCGYGPFKSKLGKYLASKLVSKASFVSARTSVAFDNFSRSNKNVVKSFDPAFDYLDLYGRMFPVKKRNGTKIIGVNLRPTWKKYILEDQNIEVSSIDDILVNYFILYIKNNPNNIYHLVSLNSDQFGFSDLNLLSRIKHEFLYDDHVVLIEKELSIAQLCETLDLCDTFISMRFHGCIFGLARGCKVVGLDYTLGGKGKVNELLEEFGNDDSKVINISSLLREPNNFNLF